MEYVIKVIVTAGVVVAVSEIAKRSSLLAALLASLPLTSLLAFIWLYLGTGDTGRVAKLAIDIFWLVLPSLPLFLLLPYLLNIGWNFWLSLILSSLLCAGLYAAMVWALKHYAAGS